MISSGFVCRSATLSWCTVPRFVVDDADDLLDACVRLHQEGIVLKRLDARLVPGDRTQDWRKVKTAASSRKKYGNASRSATNANNAKKPYRPAASRASPFAARTGKSALRERNKPHALRVGALPRGPNSD